MNKEAATQQAALLAATGVPLSATAPTYPSEQLIFLLGIQPRSGTNYLFDLLLAHPDCTASLLPEDFFVAYSHHLHGFVQSVLHASNPDWGLDEAGLYGSLRKTLTGWLAPPGEPRRIIAKTPSVAGLDYFFQLFPTSQVVILVRDGRAVLESGMRSFSRWTFDSAAREWAAGARTIARFQQSHASRSHQFTLVRYEDLYTQQAVELKRLFEFLNLNTQGFNFNAVDNIPVRGSSVLRGAPAADVHWQPVAKTADFNPLERFKDWTPAQHARFNWLAGDALRLFGYQPVTPAGSPAFWAARNRWLDARQDWTRWHDRLQRRWRRRQTQ